MDMLFAVFLGLLQGATEFLPVSSSGHLALAEYFLGLKQTGLAFDIALHFGTLIAILLYFRREFLEMAKAVLAYNNQEPEMQQMRRLAGYLCLATMPAVIAGLFLNDLVESTMRQPGFVIFFLTAAGILLLVAEKKGRHSRPLKEITLSDAILIGLSQALALFPGVSRSGITMTCGLFRDLDRPTAARFSFLLSAPIIFGAGVFHIPDMIKLEQTAGMPGFFLTGFLSAALSGYFFIAFLLKFVRSRTFAIFAYYRFALAGLGLVALLFLK